MTKSIFQTVLLVVLAGLAVVAVLIFAGILPGFREKKIGVAGDLTVWSGLSTPGYRQVMINLASAHDKEFSINYTDQGNDLDTNLVNALASGKGPDVIIAPHELILKHRDKFALIPFTSVPLRSYQDTFIDEASLFTEKEGFLAMPLAVDPMVLYYNKDLYNNAGILKAPTNWEQVVAIQPSLTKVGERSRLTQSAFAFGTFNNNNNAKDVLSLLILQAGGSPAISADGQVSITLNSNFGFVVPPTNAALSFFLEFADPLKSTYCWNRSLPEAKESFLGEGLANYFGFASEAPYIREKNPHLNFDINLVPQTEGKNRTTFGRLYGVAVLKSSAKISAAWPMVFALTGTEYSKDSIEILNFAPARRSLLVPDPAISSQKVVFDSALISKGWFDFAPTETKNIFQTMAENTANGRLAIGEAVSLATEEISKLLSK